MECPQSQTLPLNYLIQSSQYFYPHYHKWGSWDLEGLIRIFTIKSLTQYMTEPAFEPKAGYELTGHRSICKTSDFSFSTEITLVSLSSLPLFGWRSGIAKGIGIGNLREFAKWSLDMLGGLGARALSCSRGNWGGCEAKPEGTQASHRPPGLFSRVCDRLLLGRKARTWNLQMACGGLSLGDIQVERGWQRMKINLQPKSEAAAGRRSGLPRGQAGPWSGWNKEKGEEAPGIEWEISGKFKHWIRKSEMKPVLGGQEKPFFVVLA